MRFTDIFIKRPVLSTVVSLLILLVGVRSIMEMEIREYPLLESTKVTVTTAYPGASSELIQGFITQPLQQAIAEAKGIDFLSSSSTQGFSTIEAQMELNYDANDALAEIQSKVASQRNALPVNAQDPVINSTTGEGRALMYIAFFSETMRVPEITDYLAREVQPKLQALSGVGKAELLGRRFALRVWLDPQRLAAVNLTSTEIVQTLRENNYLSGVGQTKGELIKISLTSNTDVSNTEQFKNLVIKSTEDTIIRLKDVARVELGSQTYENIALYKGKPSTYVAISLSPGSNPLSVAERVKELLPDIKSQLPSGLQVELPYDASEFIDDSINEVIKTLIEAIGIVLVIVFLCLGSLRAAIIPSLAVPLSLIGGAFIMLVLGFSLNLLTLLSLVLAIGLVVDDAIIIVENIHRHIVNGKSKKEAAIIGAREMASPIIAMTITLVAVYAPIGFMGGLVGSLFTEFAFTLAGAVVISGIIALTLSPMLASKVLKPHGESSRFESAVEGLFEKLANVYQRSLTIVVKAVSPVIMFALVVLVSIFFMVMLSEKELAPTEDRGIILFQGKGSQTATLEYLQKYGAEMQTAFEQVPGYDETFMLVGMTSSDAVFGGFKMKPWSERDISQFDIMPQLQSSVANITGLKTALFPIPSLPGSSGGLPFQFVVTSGSDFNQLNQVADELVVAAMQSGNFTFVQKSIDIDKPVTRVKVDRDRAADLGLSMEEIGQELSSMLGGGYINRFNMEGRSYEVIPQVERYARDSELAINDYYIRADSGELVPLGSVVNFEHDFEPSSRTQFNQLNSITIEGIPVPSVPMGDAVGFMKAKAADILPRGFSYDFKGESRQFENSGSALIVTFFISLLVIYLVLAAQFESWRDPLIILVSVPMSIAGAMAFIMLGFASMNIYTQVGLITLIGVVAKNGILIVEFANTLQQRGRNRRDAVIEAAAIRLRPIIMTSLALIVAMIPLLIAVGPGAQSRFAIGITIVAGLGIGTILTLYVLPAFYIVLAKKIKTSNHEA
ncbi:MULTISPECIES: efflux RND transporter permease subunit [unclassified Colwellia]|uniref:efflux RND transporter permease subunit n=1 Tax=unclassified Colwellia TaxID=196834 RepID=UPI0015F7647F|nr:MULTISPECIES: efflux RND transporter permease subunit [unclassified Colwellia]MBA6378902.1 efflux RND transporter permease subunit [Colwellia sp. BRX10-7]MBA6386683.1 efflux RND transporter permease subunit [Colwellia sp. BRX10-2]MBA6401010.1 efflux RND transporter permease subunit [Colwellia sp. BRX10-5]MBA6405625.1 efflux RND transporter permease subunit [Colwellia sp. BRX10-1]